MVEVGAVEKEQVIVEILKSTSVPLQDKLCELTHDHEETHTVTEESTVEPFDEKHAATIEINEHPLRLSKEMIDEIKATAQLFQKKRAHKEMEVESHKRVKLTHEEELEENDVIDVDAISADTSIALSVDNETESANEQEAQSKAAQETHTTAAQEVAVTEE